MHLEEVEVGGSRSLGTEEPSAFLREDQLEFAVVRRDLTIQMFSRPSVAEAAVELPYGIVAEVHRLTEALFNCACLGVAATVEPKHLVLEEGGGGVSDDGSHEHRQCSEP